MPPDRLPIRLESLRQPQPPSLPRRQMLGQRAPHLRIAQRGAQDHGEIVVERDEAAIEGLVGQHVQAQAVARVGTPPLIGRPGDDVAGHEQLRVGQAREGAAVAVAAEDRAAEEALKESHAARGGGLGWSLR